MSSSPRGIDECALRYGSVQGPPMFELQGPCTDPTRSFSQLMGDAYTRESGETGSGVACLWVSLVIMVVN